jgi:EAL domain-containing protein (putative c-di-GMP-specific phosphodiesterase class I)
MSVPFSFAYQPIVDARRRQVVSFEALVRGPQGQPAHTVLSQFSPAELRDFDRQGRRHAIDLATKLGVSCSINLNILPDEDLQTGIDTMRATVEMAAVAGLSASKLILEVSECESIARYDQFIQQVAVARSLGVQFAIDDFGAGYSGLNLLAEFQPDSLKLDMALVRAIATRGPRQAIVRGVLCTCEDLGIDVVAEGVETWDEYSWLLDEGVHLFQGYLFARPGFETLPEVNYPAAHFSSVRDVSLPHH